jgi:hypothetical protein
VSRLARRLGVGFGVLCALVLMVGIVGYAWLDEPLPGGVSDAGADALAGRMVASVDAEGWARTGAITWTYAGRFTHLWDRERGYVRVRRGGWEALVDLARGSGVASQDGVALEGEARSEAVQAAYAAWANDSFWLAAMNKPFDPGTTRSRVVQDDGVDALLVSYASGGVTPGDAYLWHLDPRGRPTSWQMWVSILPIGGATATWEDWVQLKTGAWVSTRHRLGPLDLRVTDLAGAETLAGLTSGSDPFAVLLGMK